MALQSLPNESEVHYINTEIPHQQNDYIPSATITKYRIGHYQFTENGTRLMSYAGENVDPETPNVWVIPGVIDINVPLPQMNPEQNVIDNNGVFNLVNNDDNPNDIEIEPDNQRNTTRNFPIIKSRPTVKSFKLVPASESRDENDSRDDVPISLGQIRVQVPTKISIQYVSVNGERARTDNQMVFKPKGSSSSVEIPAQCGILYIKEYGFYYRISLHHNDNSEPENFELATSENILYYVTSEPFPNMSNTSFYDENETEVLRLFKLEKINQFDLIKSGFEIVYPSQ